MSDVTFEQVKNLVEQMPASEVERLRDWLNQPAISETESSFSESGTWGQRLVALVNQFDLDDADLGDQSDPETWVREYRRDQTRRRNSN